MDNLSLVVSRAFFRFRLNVCISVCAYTHAMNRPPRLVTSGERLRSKIYIYIYISLRLENAFVAFVAFPFRISRSPIKPRHRFHSRTAFSLDFDFAIVLTSRLVSADDLHLSSFARPPPLLPEDISRGCSVADSCLKRAIQPDACGGMGRRRIGYSDSALRCKWMARYSVLHTRLAVRATGTEGRGG